jgi:hypothetical protein
MKKIALLFLLICSVSFGQVPSYVPTDSLVGWWPFCGDANDLSGNGHNGTINGATLVNDRFGTTNNAYSFSGDDDITIGISSIPSLENQSEITFSAWIKKTVWSQGGSQGRIISYEDLNNVSTKGTALQIQNSGFSITKSIQCDARNGANTVGAAYRIDTTTVWHHIAMVFDGNATTNNNKLKLYVDGVLYALIPFINSNYPQITHNGTAILKFGNRVTNSTSNAIYGYGGQIDDIGIWNRVLTLNEIQALYNATVSTSCCTPNTGTDTQSACYSYTWIDGNTYTASNNTATYTLTNAAGCDSVVTLDLTINSATVDAGNDQTVCLGCADIPDDSATLVATGAQSYSWDNGVTNGVAFLPTTTALYTVTGTDANGCTGTDTVTVFVGARSCVAISISGLDSASYANQTYYQSGLDTIYHTNASGCDSIEYIDITINHTGINENILKEVEVYPNPTSDIITLKGISSLTDVSYIHLLDNKGALLRKIGINETQVDLSSFSTGIYFIEIKHQLGSGRIKVIKQ